MQYIYENITPRPNISCYNVDGSLKSGILYDIQQSEMTNKNVEAFSRNDNVFSIVFTGELSQGDKTILDGIIANRTDYQESDNPPEVNPVSPSGTRFKIGVDDDGVLYTEEI